MSKIFRHFIFIIMIGNKGNQGGRLPATFCRGLAGLGDSPSEHNHWFLKEISHYKFKETHLHQFLQEFLTQRNTGPNISTTVWCVFPADDAVEREQDRVPRDPPRPRQRPTSVPRGPRRPRESPGNLIGPEGRPRVKHQRGKPARRGQLLSESVVCEKNRAEGERKMRHDGRVTHSGMDGPSQVYLPPSCILSFFTIIQSMWDMAL